MKTTVIEAKIDPATFAEWESVGKVDTPPAGAMRAEQIATIWGCSFEAARQKLGRLQKAGRVKGRKLRVFDARGAIRETWFYTLR